MKRPSISHAHAREEQSSAWQWMPFGDVVSRIIERLRLAMRKS